MPITAKTEIPTFSAQHLEAISKVLADTATGLTGSEIGYLLQELNIPDVDPANAKWRRLFNAFAEFQNEHGIANHVIVFITRALNPASYTDRPGVFQQRKDRLNSVLAFRGMQLGNDGKIHRADPATTIDQALARANRLRGALVQRDVHGDVLKFCTAELVAKNFFHAVFEAMKSLTSKIRSLAGLSGDGAVLIYGAFGRRHGEPLLAINSRETEAHRCEQDGFVNLLKGLYGMFRNPLAHEAKIEWDMNEQDALDILTMISLVHRKLDKAIRYSPR